MTTPDSIYVRQSPTLPRRLYPTYIPGTGRAIYRRSRTFDVKAEGLSPMNHIRPLTGSCFEAIDAKVALLHSCSADWCVKAYRGSMFVCIRDISSAYRVLLLYSDE